MEVKAELKDPFLAISQLAKDMTDIIVKDNLTHLLVNAAASAQEKYEKPIKSLIWGWGYQFTRLRSESIDTQISKIVKVPSANIRAQEFMKLIGDGKWLSTSFNTELFLKLFDVVKHNYKPLNYKTTRDELIPRLALLLSKNLQAFIKTYDADKKAEENREKEKVANNTNKPVQKMVDLQARVKQLEEGLGLSNRGFMPKPPTTNLPEEKPNLTKKLNMSEFAMIADIYKNGPPKMPLPKDKESIKAPVKVEVEQTLDAQPSLPIIAKPTSGKTINNVCMLGFESLFTKRRIPDEHQPKVYSEEKLDVVVENVTAKKINNVSITDFESLFAKRRVTNDNSAIIASPTLL